MEIEGNDLRMFRICQAMDLSVFYTTTYFDFTRAELSSLGRAHASEPDLMRHRNKSLSVYEAIMCEPFTRHNSDCYSSQYSV